MKQRILIVGAGFGGMWSALSATRLLDQHGRDDVEVMVLAPQAELRVRPRFYEPEVHKMVAPLGDLFDAVGVTFVQGFAERIDVEGKRVGYRNAAGEFAELAYDRLVLASGSQVVRPATAGVEHAFDVDNLEEAVRLERHLNALAERPATASRNTVVVAGGGFTGIETAAEMPARLRAALGEDADVRVIVVDRGQQIGAALGEGPRAAIAEASAELGIEWRLNSGVASVDAAGVTLSNGERIEADTVVWTVGVRANPLTEQVPAERDGQGRLHVDANLQVHGHHGVFATGDVARAACDDQGNHALMSCQHAIALGRSAGNNVAASLLGVTPIPYSQPKYVTCLDLGAWGAVFTEGWDRQIKFERQEGKSIKQQINSVWIYPPAADRATALAAADPLIPVVA
ncbi:NAD(P)/FAD-dependent oxidoreductase [Pseudomonas sp. JM0905a]|uniref:NAD(P)/FAD-dependent oxidoreductase n=1 Tax=Metapseudomonas resinovorans TaxID=53412 RepID=A0ABT4Y9C3_METRE|nr:MULTISPECIES: NAD(P)/FAD-dependent oxidoreductase [Pseudomonas]MBD2840343.1 NAD(P)/FAD-dependent oxidoreductase [Pseudomonas sp. JM0905a]MDA8485429.1 NAD(P)/FAD-dependent oxidoreductase [Pseudomonas resinovorans]